MADLTVGDTETKKIIIEDLSWSYYSIFLLIIFIIWIITGIISFIMSIVCIFYDGTPGSKIAGLILALFTGPFYWLYYIYNLSYCNKKINYYYPQ